MLAQRKGAVLCASTILKADIYPSLQSARLPQLIDGAPNFRQAHAELPVFGGGICTLLGVQRVLQALGSGPAATAARAAEQRHTLWHNLREEPLLYINGTPYVLREAAGAYTNMKEYSGIDAARLEALEERLRGEVLQEAAQLGGKVQVLYEERSHPVRPPPLGAVRAAADRLPAVPAQHSTCVLAEARQCAAARPADACQQTEAGWLTGAGFCRAQVTRGRGAGDCRRGLRSCWAPRASRHRSSCSPASPKPATASATRARPPCRRRIAACTSLVTATAVHMLVSARSAVRVC